MKIGVFDSGLGGLLITRALINHLPQYDYIYLGDTARVPYGNRSQETIYQFSRQAMEYLFAADCKLVILACNTASAEALSRLQREDLSRFPDRKVLGVVIPTVEIVTEGGFKRVGVLATASTVKAGAYVVETRKHNPDIEMFQQPAPLLVPLIENNGLQWVVPILQSYLEPLLTKNIEALLLGCTHYPFLQPQIEKLVGPKVAVIGQDRLLPAKLQDYLNRHPEIESQLSKRGKREFLVTDKTESIQQLAANLFGQPVDLHDIEYLGG